jgi:hypothetical protein
VPSSTSLPDAVPPTTGGFGTGVGWGGVGVAVAGFGVDFVALGVAPLAPGVVVTAVVAVVAVAGVAGVAGGADPLEAGRLDAAPSDALSVPGVPGALEATAVLDNPPSGEAAR